jgi:transposase InsO family protein
MKYRFIDENKKEYPTNLMGKILGVSRSGFYNWKKREGKRATNDLTLLRAIEDIHMASRKTYGSPRIFSQLKALGFKTSKSKVERLMRDNGIRSKMKKKFKATTNSKHSHPVAENILNRDFSPKAANMVWAGDITYIWTGEGWLYLAVILDLFSRQVIGWSMSERMTKELALNALTMAIRKRKPAKGLIHHTDRGSQYACGVYRRLLNSIGAICSMSRKGNCWDNAVSESFFHSLKTEMIFFEEFKTRAEATSKVFEWIEVFYNRQRIHSSIGNKTPEQFEKLAKCA